MYRNVKRDRLRISYGLWDILTALRWLRIELRFGNRKSTKAVLNLL